jgi:predicted Zn-dependent protease
MNSQPSMNWHSLAVAMSLLSLLSAMGCHTAPVSGRRQVLLVSEPREIEMGAAAFQDTLSQERPSTNPQYVEMVNRVGQRLAQVADRPEYEWEFRVIASPTANAFCLPGGKVAIYEGILPICQTEGGLATVMSHEVAHALARHGAERVSHGYLVNGLGTMLSVFMQQAEMTMSTQLMQGYGLASQYGFVLPFSRKHEMEADHVGMMLMARAGYDPSEAPRFWQRFAEANRGGEQPEFLSTHPADERRAESLQAKLADAMALYRQSPRKYGLGQPISYGQPPAQLARSEAARSDMPPPLAPVVSRMQAAATMTAMARQRESKLNRQRDVKLVSAEEPVEESPNPIRQEKIKQHLTKSLYKKQPQVLEVPAPFELDQPRAIAPKPLRVPEFNPLRD